MTKKKTGPKKFTVNDKRLRHGAEIKDMLYYCSNYKCVAELIKWDPVSEFFTLRPIPLSMEEEKSLPKLIKTRDEFTFRPWCIKNQERKRYKEFIRLRNILKRCVA